MKALSEKQIFEQVCAMAKGRRGTLLLLLEFKRGKREKKICRMQYELELNGGYRKRIRLELAKHYAGRMLQMEVLE